MTAFFMPGDWYWQIGSQIYASARNVYVPADDPSLVAWKANTGESPRPIASEAELWGFFQTVLPQKFPAWLFNGTIFVQPAVGSYTKTQLTAYAANARYNHAAVGVIVTSLSPVPFLSDPVSRNAINSAYDYAIDNPTITVQWKMSDGSFVPLDQAALAVLVNDVAAFVQSCFNCESTTVDSINSGAISTLAAINSAFGAISNVFP